jgi:glycoside/pentoside/hexuronide:cation symporter, GPH family
MNHKQVPFKERVSYGLGDTASNLIYTMITTYLMFFYTDIFGLGTAAVGTLFLVARLIDACDGPLIGILIDRTSTKWGKSRPYFLWLAFPFAIIAILTFFTPDLSATGKLVYAYVTYILLGVTYAAINIPLSSILPSLTSSSQERTVVNTYRMVGGQVGGLIVNAAVLPLVAFFGQGNDANGFLYTMILFAIVGVACFFMTFANTRERVQANNNKPIPFKEGVKALKGNTPWWLMLLLNLFMYASLIMMSQSTIYYLTYNMDRPELVPLMNGLSVLSLVTILFVPLLSKRIGKRNTLLVGLFLGIIGQFLVYFGSAGALVSLMIGGRVVTYLGFGFVAGLKFAMIADTVDYGEWKNGVRAQGLLMAASTFGVKFGMGIAGAISAWVLGLGGYIANQAQTSSALLAIEVNFIWIPLICYAICFILMLFYKLDKHEMSMQQELLERHQKTV